MCLQDDSICHDSQSACRRNTSAAHNHCPFPAVNLSILFFFPYTLSSFSFHFDSPFLFSSLHPHFPYIVGCRVVVCDNITLGYTHGSFLAMLREPNVGQGVTPASVTCKASVLTLHTISPALLFPLIWKSNSKIGYINILNKTQDNLKK